MKKNKKEKREKLSTRETLGNVGFVWKYLYRANKALFYVRIPLMLLDTATTVVSIFFLRIILNELEKRGDMKTVIFYSVALAAANFTVSFVKRIFSVYDRRQLERTGYNIKLMLAKAVSKMPFSDIEEPRMKDFISLAEGSNSFSGIIDFSTGLVGAIINVITYASIVLYVQPLILVLIAAVVVIQTVIYKIKRSNEYKWRVLQAPVVRRMIYFINILTDIRVGKEMRVYELQDYFTEKADKYLEEECMPVVKKAIFQGNGLYYLTETAKVVQKFFIYLILAVKVVFQGMLIGDFSMYLSGANQLANCLGGVVGCFSNLMTCGNFAKEFRYCIELSEEKRDAFGKETVPEGTELSIEFKNVSFKYPHTDNYVLKDISFKLNAGERLSLVGVNGSGKSTLVKLICRFYEPTEGDIYIGGVNSKTLSADEYARLLGVVFQDFKLFSFSIKENIAMNMGDDSEKIGCSIENSGLEQKIESLENGIETSVYKDFDENGVEFSGGEGQKLAIARAVYKDAPIIILDEPTAALDPIAEYEVYSHFNDLSSGKTAIYISHRLSSTRFTDKIAVLSDGVLKEFGSHNKLMALEDGLYREMFDMQAQYYV